GRVTFQDMMSQTTRGAQGATGLRGGVNPMQVGLGSQIGSVDNIHTQGFRQSTGNPLEFSIEGNGMFVVQEGESTYFTRAGNFYLDHTGTIVNPDGYFLQGFQVEETVVSLADGQLKIEIEGGQLNENSIVTLGDETIDIAADGSSFTLTNSAGESIAEITDNGDGTYDIQYLQEDPDNAGNYMPDGDSKSMNVGVEYGQTTTETYLQIPLDAQSFSVDTDGIVHYIDNE